MRNEDCLESTSLVQWRTVGRLKEVPEIHGEGTDQEGRPDLITPLKDDCQSERGEPDRRRLSWRQREGQPESTQSQVDQRDQHNLGPMSSMANRINSLLPGRAGLLLGQRAAEHRSKSALKFFCRLSNRLRYEEGTWAQRTNS